VVIAASHQKEVQTVKTSAIVIPEVHEITLIGTEDSDMNTYFFSLRHPEIQVVKWSAGSPVTAGSFFLKLRIVDHANSYVAGSIVYKEMKTPCINFDATADDVKRAMGADAVLNGLGTNSVRVTRSGNRSFSSNYGYSSKSTLLGTMFGEMYLKCSLPGGPTSASSAKISNTLTSSLPIVSEAQVTQSLETSGNGLTFTTTYGNDDGNVPLLVCNQSPSLTSLVACDTSTVMDGNEIRGSFYLDSSDPIPYNASPSEMETAINGVSGIGHVKVTR